MKCSTICVSIYCCERYVKTGRGHIFEKDMHVHDIIPLWELNSAAPQPSHPPSFSVHLDSPCAANGRRHGGRGKTSETVQSSENDVHADRIEKYHFGSGLWLLLINSSSSFSFGVLDFCLCNSLKGNFTRALCVSKTSYKHVQE